MLLMDQTSGLTFTEAETDQFTFQTQVCILAAYSVGSVMAGGGGGGSLQGY